MLINLREQSVLEVFVWIYLYKEIIFYVSFVNERSNKSSSRQLHVQS